MTDDQRQLGCLIWIASCAIAGIARDAKRAALAGQPYDYVNGYEPCLSACCNAWRRPTLPCLKTQYHRRYLVSRPSSRWDRVGHRCHDHQAMKQAGGTRFLNRCTNQVFVAFEASLSGFEYSSSMPKLCSPDVDGGIQQARTERLGPVSSTHYCASTPGLST